MEDKTKLSVVIDGKVYVLAGENEAAIQKIAHYVDTKIQHLKVKSGYNKLEAEDRSIMLALNITEDLFKKRDEAAMFAQANVEHEQEMYQIRQDIVDKDLRIDTANKLVIEYKTKVNELQKRIIELETKNALN